MKEQKESERIRGVFAPNYPRKVLWKGCGIINTMKDTKEYTIVIKWHEGSDAFIATIPELKGLSAFGDTPEQALKELNIAKRLFLEVIEEDRKNE